LSDLVKSLWESGNALDELAAARITELETLNAELTAKLREAEQDAKRYRWLRDVGDATWRPFGIREGYSAKQADVAIDAAIGAQQADKTGGA
jgi:hypothetical protein